MPLSLSLLAVGAAVTLTGFCIRSSKGESVAMSGLGLLFGGVVIFILGA